MPNKVYLFVETNDSYLDEYGICICDKDENMLESVNSASTRSLARTERKRQRAFLKRHTTYPTKYLRLYQL